MKILNLVPIVLRSLSIFLTIISVSIFSATGHYNIVFFTSFLIVVVNFFSELAYRRSVISEEKFRILNRVKSLNSNSIVYPPGHANPPTYNTSDFDKIQQLFNIERKRAILDAQYAVLNDEK